ncbi:glutamate-1-semialdehyde 2,1-aminomutase [Streptococcus ovuberis]|uniref:Glutamate-1-semialdehyde 2,1-aminomutase n=1 Tax=Streptococcus ovuberis TaxID=1936207 RepID=A0A7X6S1Q7_9STRE|nr:glutamate-1-semialdehyde 2,1-aminomutase [Streptococcus ovuberis]NKZ20416.1 glutamate-1-semialdehyde 2,1-aminomutase [Streptococcus ovuberis]
MNLEQSQQAFEAAKQIFPGGVNSPVRAFGAVGGTPRFIDRAKGAYLYDVDGNRYIDYVLSWGPMILGHAHDEVLQAVKDSVDKGTSYGAPSPLETRLGQLLKARLPYLERLRMVSSGTEATMSAIRLARGVTKRDKIIKFIGCYHGHSDAFLVAAGSGLATFGQPNSPGVPIGTAADTITLPYNDREALKACFEAHGQDIAGLIIEGIAGNMGLIPADEAFIKDCRELTRQYGALFILDEVMTGFRAHYGGAAAVYGIEPDLVCLGKVVGGGFPMAVFGGKKVYMDQIAPLGAVYQAGTLSGNPIAMTAGYETLSRLSPELFDQMEQQVKILCQGLRELAAKHQVPMQVVHRGTMFGFFFNDQPVRQFSDAAESDHDLFAKVHQGLLKRGIYLAPSQYEANFISAAHSPEDIEETLVAFDQVLGDCHG